MAGALVLIVVVVLLGLVSLTMFGVAVFRYARARPEPLVPEARMVNPTGAERAYIDTMRVTWTIGRISRNMLAGLGIVIAIAPWAALAALIYEVSTWRFDLHG